MCYVACFSLSSQVSSSVHAHHLCQVVQVITRIFERLTWHNGNNLYKTFHVDLKQCLEGLINLSHTSPLEQQCCHRVVELCQDCLLVVYLCSRKAQLAPKPPLEPSKPPGAPTELPSHAAARPLAGTTAGELIGTLSQRGRLPVSQLTFESGPGSSV